MQSARMRAISTVAFAAFAGVVFACGSEDGRPELPGGSAKNPGTSTTGSVDGGAFAPSTPGSTTPGGPTGADRCNDPTNALEGCGCPNEGAEAVCWTGPANLRRVEQCREGKAKCTKQGEFLRWGPCEGQVLPGSQGVDQNCLSTCKGECVPGTFRYCDEAQYCAWGRQDCLPNGKGGGSWGPCKETPPPAGCEPIISFPGIPPSYDDDCCKDKGFCCQVGGVDSPLSEGNCAGIVVTCN